jgi:type IV pilus assembly protein PilO
LLTVVFVSGVLFAYFGMTALPFGYRARAERIDGLKENYAKLSSEVTQARRLAADLPRVEALHAQTQRRWEVANTLLPTTTDMAGLLREVTQVGQQAGVDFVKFEPLPPTNHPYYAENPVDLAVVGSYHEVGSFLSEIASMTRLVNVGGMRLISLTGGEMDETVSASFTASAYSVTGSHVRSGSGGGTAQKRGSGGTPSARAQSKPAGGKLATPPPIGH